jgi:Zinc-finger double-stranded RNA-binding
MVFLGTLSVHTLPFKEKVTGDFDLSPGQLVAMAAARKLRIKERAARISKAWEAKQHSLDLNGFLAKKAKQKRSWIARNSKRVAASHDKSIAKAKASKKHHCNVCDKIFVSASALTIHLSTKAHANKVAGKRPKLSAGARRSRAFNKKMQASKKYHCDFCNLSFPTPGKLTTHKGTKKHLAKVASAAAAASLT